MLKRITCFIGIMIFVSIIFGCGSHKEFLLKREWQSNELPKDKIVNVILVDGSTYKLSDISFDGTKLIGTTEVEKSGEGLLLRPKEIEVCDIRHMWVDKSDANLATMVITTGAGFFLPLLAIYAIMALSGYYD